jgi:hypothetical protein
MYAVTGVDFCWVEAARRGDSGHDHSVVFTALVDASWRFYLVDIWRAQVVRRETLEEVYRQMRVHGATAVGMSVSDRKHVEDDITRYEFELKQAGTPFRFNPVWVSDLKGGEGVDADTAKRRKHIGILQPIFQAGKFFLPIGHGWFEEELLDCPKAATDDGMDAAVCFVEAADTPARTVKHVEKPAESPLSMGKLYDAIQKGKHVDAFGRRIRRQTTLKSRRPRSRQPLP